MSTMSEDILNEFLLESRENLDALDRDLVALESDPSNQSCLAGVFRTVHTIKGTAGFFQFAKLEQVAHAGENLLSNLRDQVIMLESVRTSALLAMVDAIRESLEAIESTGVESTKHYGALIEALSLLCKDEGLEEGRVTLEEISGVAIAPASAAPPGTDAETEVETPPAAPQDSGSQADAAASAQAAAAPAPAAAAPPQAPAPKPEAPQEPKAAEERAHADPRIRVDVRLLDRLMNLVGELVLARNQLLQHASVSSDTGLVSSSQRLNHITTELQEGVMKTRMQPIDHIWSRFPRVVRDLSHSCGKKIRLEMEGNGTELDKTIIEAIADPLTHLIRNAVDHGVETPDVRRAANKPETGTIRLRAYHEGGRVNIEIGDDGGGIDPERIKAKAIDRGILAAEQARNMAVHDLLGLIFAPGFSTAAAVTNISGRGVGMDVVKSNIERMAGSVDVESRVGHGTTIRIRIPLTLAIIPALVVGSGGERFAIPQVNLVELVHLDTEQAKQSIERIHGIPVFRLRGTLLALGELSQLLDLESNISPEDVNIVVLQADDRQFGLLVDAIYDTEEIVVKPLGRELKGLSVYAGSTIMGDGRVALILDVAGLVERSGAASSDKRLAAQAAFGRSVGAVPESEQLLLCRLGDGARLAIPLRAVARLEEFSPDRVERIGSEDVVQYRGEILRLIYLADIFHQGKAETDLLQVVVHTHEGRNVGFVVDAIEDVVVEEESLRREGGRRGTLGSTVIQGRVTEMLDALSVRSMAGV